MRTLISALVLTVFLGTVVFAQTSPSYNSSSNSSSSSMSAMQQITNGPVAETVADSNALIGWSSKTPSSSTSVKYGTSRDHLSQVAQATQNSDSKNHHASLSGLSPDTTYYFQVFDNGQPIGGIGTFHTVAMGDKPVQSKAVISQK
jgi:phosphodiesterase/alkaline phosphatase D-like protein